MSNTRRIFYDTKTGDIIMNIGRGSGLVTPSVQEDIETYKSLSERTEGSFRLLELQYTDYLEEFNKCSFVRVNVDTNTLEFSYDKPPYDEPQKPLTDVLKETTEDLNLVAEMSAKSIEDTEFVAEITAFNTDDVAMLAEMVSEAYGMINLLTAELESLKAEKEVEESA